MGEAYLRSGTESRNGISMPSISCSQQAGNLHDICMHLDYCWYLVWFPSFPTPYWIFCCENFVLKCSRGRNETSNTQTLTASWIPSLHSDFSMAAGVGSRYMTIVNKYQCLVLTIHISVESNIDQFLLLVLTCSSISFHFFNLFQ